MRIFLRLLLLLAFGLLTPATVQADSWLEPHVETFASPNGQFRLTVTPGAISSALAYYEDKVQGREPAGQAGNGPMAATGKLEQRQSDGSWVTVWDKPLVNEVRPVSAIVSDDGRHVATFDNWYSTGFGENVVVLYGADGSLVRSFALSDVVPAYFVDAFPRSVSSLHWRVDGSHFEGSWLRVSAAEPGHDFAEQSRAILWIQIDANSGTPQPINPERMTRLRDVVCGAHLRAVASFNEYLVRERTGLSAPESPDSRAWTAYLEQATRRLFPVSEQDFSDPFAGDPIYLLNPGDYMYRDYLDGFRDALEDHSLRGGRLVLGAPSQDALVAEIQRSARRIPAGSLTDRQLYIFADNMHWPAIHAALIPTGATLHQIDIEQPIEQSQQVLADLPPPRETDPACAVSTTESATIN